MQIPKLRPQRCLFFFVGLLLFFPLISHAEKIVCHYTYGGETRIYAAGPTENPYGAGRIQIGSYFQFRVVFEKKPANTAAIKIYTYADRHDGPVIIHQASYPYPRHEKPGSAYGFSGYQTVYEPVRDGELQYWCELTKSRFASRKVKK